MVGLTEFGYRKTKGRFSCLLAGREDKGNVPLTRSLVTHAEKFVYCIKRLSVVAFSHILLIIEGNGRRKQNIIYKFFWNLIEGKKATPISLSGCFMRGKVKDGGEFGGFSENFGICASVSYRKS